MPTHVKSIMDVMDLLAKAYYILEMNSLVNWY